MTGDDIPAVFRLYNTINMVQRCSVFISCSNMVWESEIRVSMCTDVRHCAVMYCPITEMGQREVLAVISHQ